MKTHEFANQLDVLAKFLKSLPNIEMERSFSTILDLMGDIKPSFIKTSMAVNLLPEGIEELLREMPSSEIESYIKSKSEVFSVKNLQDLAERLGVAISKRQKREALINVIVRYFEAGQMESLIQSTRKDNVQQDIIQADDFHTPNNN